MSVAAVEGILDVEPEKALGARELRRLLFVEVFRLEAIKEVLFRKALDGETGAAIGSASMSARLPLRRRRNG